MQDRLRYVNGHYLNRYGLCAEYCGNRHTFIAVRKKSGESVYICDACWNQDHPDQVPVRVRHSQ